MTRCLRQGSSRVAGARVSPGRDALLGGTSLVVRHSANADRAAPVEYGVPAEARARGRAIHAVLGRVPPAGRLPPARADSSTRRCGTLTRSCNRSSGVGRRRLRTSSSGRGCGSGALRTTTASTCLSYSPTLRWRPCRRRSGDDRRGDGRRMRAVARARYATLVDASRRMSTAAGRGAVRSTAPSRQRLACAAPAAR